jgi:hypothetical protein
MFKWKSHGEIATIVFRNRVLPEHCAETRRELGFFRYEPQALAAAIASRAHRRPRTRLPKPNSAYSFLLSANSKFTQKRHHRAPVREAGLKQVKANKSREKVPVRAYVVSQCQGQQNKTPSDQTKSTLYGHNISPSQLQVGRRKFALRRFAFRYIFRGMRMHGWN